jgi:Cyclic nucleotide-binding domain
LAAGGERAAYADHPMVQAMKDYYEGEEGTPGWKNRKLAFLQQELLSGLEDSNSQEVARRLTNKAKVEEYQESDKLYAKGGKAEFIFFILSGRIDLEYDGEVLSSLGEGKSVGEYPLIGVSPNYYVTAIARKRTVAALVSYSYFQEIAEEHPKLWKTLARKLARRMNFPRDEDEARKHVLFLVHGIRTFSPWQSTLKDELAPEFKKAGLELSLTNFGWFDLIRFLAPFNWFRRKKSRTYMTSCAKP